MVIKDIQAFEILDSRGTPTVRTMVILSDGRSFQGDAPSGASTGTQEALEKRDGLDRFFGKGVKNVIEEAKKHLYPLFIGQDCETIRPLEDLLLAQETSVSKTRYGANIILSLDIALYRAVAAATSRSIWDVLSLHPRSRLPIPMINILNGGCHAQNGLAIQEFMIVPHGFTLFSESIRAGVEIFWSLKGLLKQKGFSTGVGDEGGFAPQLNQTEEALNVIMEAIEKAGYRPQEQVSLALDLAASEFFHPETGQYAVDGTHFTSDALISRLSEWMQRYPFISLEDPIREGDWHAWRQCTEQLGSQVMIVGDDLLVTQKSLLEKAVHERVANAILIKPNQVGSLRETIETVQYAHQSGYKTILSHRSGETEDFFIADLAFALQTPFIKMGSVCRSERTAKYNRLLEIEERFGYPLASLSNTMR